MSAAAADISIVVPLFNREALVADTIDSVLRQSTPQWQLLVIDDGSTDRSFEVASGYADCDRRIRVWRRSGEIAGAPTCRNEGWRRADTEYVIFLDSDDLLAPHCVQTRQQAMADAPPADGHVFPCEIFSQTPGDTGEVWFHEARDLLTGFLRHPLWQTTSVAWRRGALESLGGFREGLSCWQDWELQVRALALGLVFQRHDTAPDCYYRRSPGQRISQQAAREVEYLRDRVEMLLDIGSLLQQRELLSGERMTAWLSQFERVVTSLLAAARRDLADRALQRLADAGSVTPPDLRQMTRRARRAARMLRFRRFWSRYLSPQRRARVTPGRGRGGSCPGPDRRGRHA